MQLISMEVNQLGSADRTQVAGLVSGFNVICGRRGSGKSSLVAWLRGLVQPAVSNHFNGSSQINHPASASGRLTLRIGDGEYQLERHHPAGRTDSKVLRRTAQAWNNAPSSANGQHQGHQHTHLNGHGHSQAHGLANGSSGGSTASGYEENWSTLQARLGAVPPGELLTPLQRDAFDRLAAIRSDSQAASRLWDLARELRLDDIQLSPSAQQRQDLLVREQELLAQLSPLEGMQATREGLLGRRRQLESELDRLRRQVGSRQYAPQTDDHHRLADRTTALDRDIQVLRDEISQLDAAILRRREGHSSDVHRQSYRDRLLALDAQLARWRNTLTEIRAHRERLESAATDAQLDSQLGEQFTPINQATPRLALRSLEAQIVEARRHFDALLDNLDATRQDARHELPQTLRLMQRELHEVCQQLSRHESLTSNRATQDQILQLKRCEAEMRQAVERLISERGELLRTIAHACQLSVDQVAIAYSDSCRCADHPHLDQWLSAIAAAPEGGSVLADRNELGLSFVDELTSLENRRSHAMARLETLLRDRQDSEGRLRRLGAAPRIDGRYDQDEAEVLSELDHVNEALLRLEARDRLRVDLTDIRRRLERLPHEADDAQSLRGRYLRHLAGLTGMPVDRANQQLLRDHLRRDAYTAGNGPARYGYHRSDLNRVYSPYPQNAGDYGRYEPVRGHYVAGLDTLDTPDVRLARLEEVAVRLAIIDLLSVRGHGVALILDETLDGLEGARALTAVRYLAGYCQASRAQVIAFSDDSDLVAAAKTVHGNIQPIVVSQALSPVAQPVAPPVADYDVNRWLSAYANDFETDKWYEPDRSPPARAEVKKPARLTERSDIHEVPSLSASEAARLLSMGIVRVADLLDADASWLAGAAGLPGVNADVVHAWQNECRLLCAMPQLRPFDARVLAGAGVRDQHQLAAMEPGRLLERVENFLATERGKRIMRSGSSYELSRLTAWVASAKRGYQDSFRSSAANSHATNYETAANGRPRRPVVHRADAAHSSAPTYHVIDRDDHSPQDYSAGEDQGRRTHRNRPPRDPNRFQRTTRRVDEVGDASSSRGESQPKTAHESRRRQKRERADSNGHSGEARRTVDGGRRLRFYLELSSPIVDAPSIGDRMAQHLIAAGVHTVADLLNSNSERLASDLGHPRVTSAIIIAWQDQSRLVCRIPNLRGHDAQILVACGITTPEELQRAEPNALLAKVAAFANSTQGQRVLRGSAVPDMDEVKQWISWSTHCRNLLAA